MIAKTFEIRDKGTFIPVMAVKLKPDCEQDRYLLARAGYGRSAEQQAEYVTLWRIDGGLGKCTSDHYEWGGDTRTMPTAHEYIINNFDTLQSGEVIDVEFILGETHNKKISESKGPY